MVIYTRTGDKGQTSLFNGQRVSKADLRVEVYGTVDELNSVIGVVVTESQKSPLKADQPLAEKVKSQKYNSKLKNELTQIQKDLFSIGSTLANPVTSNQQLAISNLKRRVKEFENMIDDLTGKLPALNNFILPGGGNTGSLLHFARTVARRAERKVVLLDEREKVDKNIVMYLNRLSDLLFTMARVVNYREKQKEMIWTKR
jgi:cob(I)alamin adenosyltransferase